MAAVELIERYMEVKEEIAKLESEKNKLRDELVQLFGDNFEGIVDGKIKIKINKTKRYILDTKKVKQVLGEKAKQFEKEVESIRINAKRV